MKHKVLNSRAKQLYGWKNLFKFSLPLMALSCFAGTAWSQPKLVVGIVVDQMRYDYLERYQSRFCDSGFKRLMNEGYNYQNAHFNYVPTYTAPGHASIYTGTTPSNHGIIANDWFDRQRGGRMYCTDDPNATVTGGKGYGNSPKNLFAGTLSDQLKLATQNRAKVIGLSIKDRGAILPAGHNANGAYWFDSKTGKMVGSSWYSSDLPEWLHRFNRQGKALQYLDLTWNTLFPIYTYTASAPDDNPYENSIAKEGRPVFPYNLKELQKEKGYGLLSYTPFSNSLLIDLALATISGEDMGKDEVTDFLSISFSGPDYAGHFFGPQAVEIEDIYLRLDREIARLIHALDQQMGKGNYTLFLCADHGANEVPALLNANGMYAGLLTEDTLQYLVNQALKPFGDSLLLDVSNEQVYLNHSKIKEKGLDMNQITRVVCEALNQHPGVYQAYSVEEVQKGQDPFFELLRNGYHPKRSGDVLIRTMPGWMDYKDKGTTHGSGYSYDTRTPMLFYGYGVNQGKSSRKVQITDIAPTLSIIMGIQFPNACTGEPLGEVLGY